MDATAALRDFWGRCREALPGLPEEVPAAWSFGATPAQADALLALVLDGVKTATASALWDYAHDGERVPEAGDYGIVLDGSGLPRALLETTAVTIVPFDEVSAEHARAEGEGDRTIATWRDLHERFWRAHASNPRRFEPGMPVVCERFTLLYAARAAGAAIRDMSQGDAGEVLTLQRAAYATEAQRYQDPFLPALTQTLDELVAELETARGLVATLDGRIVAAVRWTVRDDIAHIGRLTVAPDQQGGGLGTELLGLAERRSGAVRAELFTGSDSAANLRLYARAGYAETRRESLHPGVELLHLAKSLR